MPTHPGNPYRNPPDFVSLAQAYSPLQKFLVYERKTIDFKNDDALRCLTQAIMFCDFGVQLQIPEDRLCPPVPNRMNYVLWIQDIMRASQAVHNDPTVGPIRGIDIGTGATAIYALLACSLEKHWEIIGTELDDRSYGYALQNVRINNLDKRITIKRAQSMGTILFPLEDDAVSCDFTMCNPPFYSSPQEMDELAKAKSGTPNAVCTGSGIEMIYPNGGEVGFVGQMVEESIRFQKRCRWYTSMLGRMSSVVEIVELFRRKNISNYAMTEFNQGRTRRWAVGWSFSEYRLPDAISRILLHQTHMLTPYLPPHTTLRQPLPLPNMVKSEDLTRCVVDILKAIENVRVNEYTDGQSFPTFRVEATENTWSRSARRKRKRDNLKTGMEVDDGPESVDSEQNPSLVCDIRIISSQYAWKKEPPLDSTTLQPGGINVESEWIGGEVGEEAEGYPTLELEHLTTQEDTLECQWVFGADYKIFETLFGHVGRKLIDSMKS